MSHLDLLKPYIYTLNSIQSLSIYFRYLVIISPWKRAWPLFLGNLKLLQPKLLYAANFCWNWPSGYGEDIYILLFHNYLPLEKGVVLYLNKLKSPFLKDALCAVCLKLAPWFWRDNQNVKVYGQTDDRRPEKLTRAFSLLGELKKIQTFKSLLFLKMFFLFK